MNDLPDHWDERIENCECETLSDELFAIELMNVCGVRRMELPHGRSYRLEKVEFRCLGPGTDADYHVAATGGMLALQRREDEGVSIVLSHCTFDGFPSGGDVAFESVKRFVLGLMES